MRVSAIPNRTPGSFDLLGRLKTVELAEQFGKHSNGSFRK